VLELLSMVRPAVCCSVGEKEAVIEELRQKLVIFNEDSSSHVSSSLIT